MTATERLAAKATTTPPPVAATPPPAAATAPPAADPTPTEPEAAEENDIFATDEWWKLSTEVPDMDYADIKLDAKREEEVRTTRPNELKAWQTAERERIAGQHAIAVRQAKELEASTSMLEVLAPYAQDPKVRKVIVGSMHNGDAFWDYNVKIAEELTAYEKLLTEKDEEVSNLTATIQSYKNGVQSLKRSPYDVEREGFEKAFGSKAVSRSPAVKKTADPAKSLVPAKIATGGPASQRLAKSNQALDVTRAGKDTIQKPVEQSLFAKHMSYTRGFNAYRPPE